MEILSRDQALIKLIIDLNTKQQLLKKGIDSTGTPLDKIGGAYAFSTVEIKRKKGQQADFVTLKDTGQFYSSWRIFLDANHDLEIITDPIKAGVSLLDRWGTNVLGLTPTSQGIFNAAVADRLPKIVLNQLLKAA